MLFNNVDLHWGEVHPLWPWPSCILIRSGVMEVNFHRLRDKSKNTGAISSNFVVGISRDCWSAWVLFTNIGKRSKVKVTGSQMQNCVKAIEPKRLKTKIAKLATLIVHHESVLDTHLIYQNSLRSRPQGHKAQNVKTIGEYFSAYSCFKICLFDFKKEDFRWKSVLFEHSF